MSKNFHQPSNPEDDDLVEAVEATELYELTLEQVLETPVILDANTRRAFRVKNFVPNGMLNNAVAFLGDARELNYTTIMATALVHGKSIFVHEHAEIITEIKQINNDVLFSDYDVYNMTHEGYSPVIEFGATGGRSKDRIIWCDTETHDMISTLAVLFNLPAGTLATACMLLSFAESTTLPPKVVDECKRKSKYFNIVCNIFVENLKAVKYNSK
jgi:hypothetical protein